MIKSNSGKSAMMRVTSVVLGLSVLLTGGCKKYGTVSDKSYELVTALYSICNLQDADRLPGFFDTLEQHRDSISPKEYEWLLDIAEQANQGNWDTATKSARTMLEDQTDH